ncbi:MAG: ABC transporter substrate-binding protein, partial [Anaerolineae bacterium]
MHPSTRRIETTPTVKGVGPTHRMGPTRRMGLLLSSFLGLGLALALAWALLSQPAAEAQITEPHIRLEKNDDYYDAASVVITQATSLFIDQDEAWTRYQAGELDTIAPPGSALETIKGSPVYGPQLHAYPRQCTYYFGFSHDVPPFDDPLVRGAFASAIDRRRLISEVEVLTGDEFPALTLAPPGTFGHVDGYAAGIGRPYSPTLAQNLLATSGYTGIPTITLLVPMSSHHIAIAEGMRDLWSETLGITVTVEDMAWRSYLDLLRDGSAAERPGILRIGWCADYPDAHNWHSGANSFWLPVSRYDNPAYDALVAAAAAEADPADRLELYEEAEATLVMTDTALLPVYYYVNHRLTRPDLDRT